MAKSAEDLKRFALYKMRLKKENEGLSVEQQLSVNQINERARRAVKLGVINDHGNVIERPTWDFDPRKR
jgi:hypothetical protein